MPAARTLMLFLLLALAAPPAHAQTTTLDPETIKSSLGQFLSIATFGTVTVRDQGAEVTRSGKNYEARLPLDRFLAPPDAAINAMVHLTDQGLLDVTSMTLPPAGTIESAPAGGSPMPITYSIGHQAITAKVDPRLTTPSSYSADFKAIRLLSEQGEQHGEQTIDRYTINGTVSADSGGLLTLASQASGTDIRFIGHGPNGFASDVAIRASAGHFSVEGLDRIQGTRLLTALRGIPAVGKTSDQPSGISQDQREAMRAIVEATSGLLNRAEAEEILEDIRFAAGTGSAATSGTVRRLRLNVTGDAVAERLNTQFGMALDGISSSGLSAENAMFIPHRVDLKTNLSGVRIGPLMALLHAVTEPGTDPAALLAQAMTLLADPQVRISIEALSFDSGPLQIKGSAKVVPRPDGQLGVDIHIAASGMDKLLAQTQSQPSLQQVMPMVLLAKGIGRPEGDSLIWDISLGDGPMTVNGIPLGQAGGKSR
jgi:Uncharacterized protein conserved in bacteria (DUF2125)